MAKGDADKLRADLDDGYAKLANLLLEALSCAPLTGTEYAVCMFIMRRTYGWAKGENRTSGKSDVIQAEEVARGTNTPRSSVHKAIRELVKASIITSELAEAGNIFAYGMNPDIAAWGDGGPDWKQAKVCLKEAREAGTYSRNRTDLYPKSDIGIAEIGQTSGRKRTDPQGTKPCGTGAEGTPTDSIQTVLQTEDRGESVTPAALPPVEDTNPADFAHMDACNSSFTQAFVGYFRGSKPPQAAQAYAQQCRQQLAVPNAGLTEDEVEAQVRSGNGPRAGTEQSGNFGAERYLERLSKEKQPARASPKRLIDDSRVLPDQAQFGEARP